MRFLFLKYKIFSNFIQSDREKYGIKSTRHWDGLVNALIPIKEEVCKLRYDGKEGNDLKFYRCHEKWRVILKVFAALFLMSENNNFAL